MIQKLKRQLVSHYVNMRGWRTNRKIVVFESDDWGSIRMPSKSTYEKLVKKGLPLDQCPYNKNDSLATPQDLDALFSVLQKFKDRNNHYPVFTANTVVANPDFQKIKEANFEQYFFEPFIKTLERSSAHSNSYQYWQEGIRSGIFYPQFHGREHLNISFWLSLLQKKDHRFLQAFDYEFWGLSDNLIKDYSLSVQAAFDIYDNNSIENQKFILISGTKLFKQIFGFTSKTFIPNNFILSPELYPVLYKTGIDFVQGMHYQLIPQKRGQRIKQHRYLGQQWDNIKALVRNCTFEPFSYGQGEVDRCFSSVKNAFLWHKPAIITTHRANYIGHINPENRTKNLIALKELLHKLLKTWPDIEFLSSEQLIEKMDQKN